MNGFDYFRQSAKNSYKHFRSTLKVNEQNVYDKIVDGFFDYSNSITVFGVTIDVIQSIFEKIRQDIPSLFFVENVSFQYMPLTRLGSVIPKYRFDKGKTEATLVALYTKCQSILGFINLNSDLEKEKGIHDYFCRNVIYDNSFAASSFECVGPLLFGKGVCEGISRAAKLLFDFVGVKSLVVHGESSQQQGITNSSSSLHAWNMVNINSVFYHLDITFDLTIQAFDIVRYDYYNLSDAEICADHIIHSSSIPKCTQRNSYYLAHGMFMMTQKDFSEYLQKCIKSKQRDIVFQLPVVSDVERVKEKITEIVSKYAFRPFSFLSQYQLASNETQFVFHLHFM